MFKLIAIRILEGCKPHIKKCLKENVTYYLSNEYLISDYDKSIKKRSKYIETLPTKFFSLYNNNSELNINISAIVGMNGDGKSSLIEIILRLLNNSAIHYEMNPNQKLIEVSGVIAELFYLYNGEYYVLSQTKNEITLCKYTSNSIVPLEHDEARKVFPYTMISNYSHYAYNINEMDKEYDKNQHKCWIEEVFHKNDGYQSPISIHPYRNKGNIDINNEKYLSNQRLLSLFLNSDNPQKNTTSFRNINNKQATHLKITDIGYSKLLKKTIEEYFHLHKETRLLSDLIDKIEKLETVTDSEKEGTINEVTFFLYNLYHRIYNPNHKLFDEINSWCKDKKIFSTKSDLANLLDLVKSKNLPDFIKNTNNINNIINSLSALKEFNLCQIQRIELIDRIYDIWKKNNYKIWGHKLNECPNLEDTIQKDYNNYTTKEKCLHYIIYKTISIFETYPHYGMPCLPFESSIFVFQNETGSKLNYAMETLEKEWIDKTHITLKLRQVYKYYHSNHIFDLKDNSNNTFIRIDDLKTKGIDFNDLENLPPRIFNSEIYFTNSEFTTSNNKELIPFDCFSSGEKQKLNSLGAILYHVRNLDSISESQNNLIKYRSVNIILEEIELYFHPEWQRTYIYELLTSLYNTDLKIIRNINLIFVTHSPFILSDIPKCNVLFLQGGMPNEEMQENTFGANINSILKNGFFLPSLPMGEFAYKKINSLFSRLNSHEFNRDDLENMYQEIIRVGEPYLRNQLLNLIEIYRFFASDNKLKEIVEHYINSIKND